MPWVKFDDQYADHPKLDDVSDAAFRMHVAATCFASRYLTDGYIKASTLPKLCKHSDPVATAEELVAAGLFERAPGGYQVHDYLDYNPSKADVEFRRESDRKRKQPGQRDAELSARNPNGIRSESEPSRAGARPRPVPSRPVPNPTDPTDPSDPNAGGRARGIALRGWIAEAVYGTTAESLPPNERGEVEDAAGDLAEVEGVTHDEIERRVRHVGVMWPNLAAPSAALIARRWAQIGADLAKRQLNGTSDATHQRSHAETATRRREAFAAAGLLSDADDGGAGRDGAAGGPDDLSRLPESSAAETGLRELRQPRDGLPDVSRGAADRQAPPRGPDPDAGPGLRLHDPTLRQRPANAERQRTGSIRAGPATRT